jgi:prephenate dehydratase
MLSADPQFDTPFAAAFQGAPGSFSEDAALALLGSDAQLLTCPRLEEVFDAVRGGRARLGVVPIENVSVCYDLLLDRELSIVGEHCMHFDLALVVKPGTAFDRIRKVLSHPMLLGQCGGFFRRNPFVEPLPAHDSALAVERVVHSERDDLAAIASRRAAEVYGGQVIATSIEEDPTSFTRFLKIARPSESRLSFDGDADEYKTSIVFTTNGLASALHECLGPFARADADVAKIESRPLADAAGGSAYYLDVVGRIDDERMATALDALEASASKVRVLGCYRRHA